MIQNEFKQAIFEFVKSVSDLDEIISIILFGSVAKGNAATDSDIDIVVIASNLTVEPKIIKIANEMNDRFNKKFQVIVKTKKLEGLDPSMIESISTEAILLYGLPIKVKQKDLELEPFTLAIYSLTHLPQSEKMKFKRSIFGSESVFKGYKKKYKTIVDGLLKSCNGAKLGRGSIIFPSKRKELIRQMEHFKVKFRTYTVYANNNILEWINTFNKSAKDNKI